MLKFKVGDTVKITIGKDKGRQGKIEKIFPKEGSVVIPGLNVYKKHVKGFRGQNIPGNAQAFEKKLCPTAKSQTPSEQEFRRLLPLERFE